MGYLGKAGESATPPEWGTRELSEPSIVSAFAAIEDWRDFQDRCQRERRRLGVGGVKSKLGDGAKWIGNVGDAVFGKSEECLDIDPAARETADSRRQFVAEVSHVSACVCCRLQTAVSFWEWSGSYRHV
jgi:hypothetical protein